MLDSPLLIAAAILVGLAVGSFLNVVIHRLPRMMDNEWRAQCAELEGKPPPELGRYNLWVPRSQCPSCRTPIRARDNIPVLSWLLLGGKCAHCKAPISPRYPIVEVLTAVLSGVVAWRFGLGWTAALVLLFAWTLIALTFIDADTTLLPDDLTLPLLWLGLLANLAGMVPGVTLRDAVLGAVAGYLVLWAIYWAFKLATGKEGMGYGDFKLLAALGAWMGWKALLPIVLLSSVVGAIVGIVLIVLARRGREIPIPFGPYLATAGMIVMLVGPRASNLLLSG
ncbi:MAG TPA: A24 family peptidase [Burkholderiaceae bacterium]|nr:A24 family peptidase [Burkholderiaceae bacterium]HQR72555.1 A24 family peptidase [Burkholderiaceae bacterium]